MLTKQDIQQIGDILEAKSKKVLQEELRPIKKDLEEVKNQIEDVEIKLDEKVSELNMEIFRLRAEFKEEIKNIKRSLNRMYKHQETIIRFFNEEALSIKKRLDNLETRINISPN